MSFRYGICNETFGEQPLSDAVAMAREVGYTGWEVAPFMLADDIREFKADQRRRYRDVVEAAGLDIVGLHWLLAKTEGLHLTTEDAEVRRRTADYFATLAELCRDLGGNVMVLGSPQQRNFPPQQSSDSAMQNAAEVLDRVCQTLQQTDVRIALEPLGRGEGNFLNTADQARQLIEMVGSPMIGLHLDVKAMSDEPQDIPDIIRKHADILLHFHANDPNLRGPGMGDVRFEPILQTLSQVGYDGWIDVEVFDYSPGVDALVRESYDNLKAAESAIV